MADNRYSVDDILRELNDNKQRTSAPVPAPAAPPKEPRRPVAPPPKSDEDDFWEMKQPVQRRPPAEQRPTRERPAQEPPARRPMREPPPGAATNPRLGQTIPPPRNREEMGKLLGRFDDNKQDPLGNLDFLEREPDISYSDTPVKNFVPDWDSPRDVRRQRSEPALQQGGRGRHEEPVPRQPRGYRDDPMASPQQPGVGYRAGQAPPPQPGGYRDDPRIQSRQPGGYRDNQAVQPQQYGGYGDDPLPPQPRSFREDRAQQQSRLQQGARREIPGMYNADERSRMSNAAKLITSGGFGDEPDYDIQQQSPRRTRPPVSREQSGYRGTPLAAQHDIAPRAVQQVTQQIPPMQQRPRPASVPPPGPRTAAPLPDEVDVSRYEPRLDAPAAGVKEQPRAEAQDTGKQGGAKRESNQAVAEQLGKMKVSLFIRVLVNLLALVGVVYLALAGEYDFPLPSFIAGEENIGAFLWATVGMVIISALVSGNTIGGGILALFKLRPSNDTYSALAVFACLIQGSYIAMQPQLMESYGDNLYLPMAALMLLFNTFGKLILLSRMVGSFHLAAAKGERHVAEIMDNREFARRISGDIVGDEPRIAYFTEAASVDAFLEQAFSESKAEDISKIIAPTTALAALLMALVSYLFNRDIFVSACVYTAALCITAPLAGVIASNLPLSITNGKLSRFGASLCGYDAVSRFADTNGVLLRCSQLFPKGSVSIQDIKILDRRPIDQVIIDAASVLCACDSNLSGIFRDMVQDISILHQPENLEYYDDMGLSAWVNGRRVLIGNRNLMMSYGVSIPGVEFERPYTTGNNEVMYLANSGEAAAMYVLSYKADKQMRRAMELLCDRDMAVCVYSTDPNLTAEKISGIYNFPKELLSIIPASMQAGSEKYLVPKGKVKASVVHNGTPASYLRTILAAQSCSRCITLETALILMSVVIGFAIVTFFAFTQQMETLTWITIAVYQFFWLLIELVIPLVKH